MSSNIADMIEQYILSRMAEEQNGKVELRRNDIADKISCAPSQISYVLNTRFTQDKGFSVESRRGLGGFIRIIRVPMQNMIYDDMISKLTPDVEIDEVKGMINYLLQHEMITSREGALIMQTVACSFATLDPRNRAKLLQSLFITLSEFS